MGNLPLLQKCLGDPAVVEHLGGPISPRAIAKLAGPFMGRALRKIGDDASAGLRRVSS
jgi:hypothetical protein